MLSGTHLVEQATFIRYAHYVGQGRVMLDSGQQQQGGDVVRNLDSGRDEEVAPGP